MQSNPIKQLLLAAEKGDAAGQFNLGVLYDSRLDDNGSAHLTPAQLAKARRFAGNWKPKRQDKAAMVSDMANGAGAAMAPIAGLLPQDERHRIVPGPCLPSAASWILRTGSLEY
jgi:TPR repeat protein